MDVARSPDILGCGIREAEARTYSAIEGLWGLGWQFLFIVSFFAGLVFPLSESKYGLDAARFRIGRA